HADLDEGPGQVAGQEGLVPGVGPAHGLDHHVGAEAAGELPDGLDGIDDRSVDGVGGTESLGPLQLAGVDVDADDPAGAGQARCGDGGVADPAAPDDGDSVAPPDVAGVDGGAEPRHHATADEPGGLGTGS